MWNYTGYGPISSLVISQIDQPLIKKVFDIHVESGCTKKRLCISCPSQSFVPLRTIGRNIEEIPPLTPLYVFLKLIDQFIRSRQRTCKFHIRVECNCLKIVNIDLIYSFNF